MAIRLAAILILLLQPLTAVRSFALAAPLPSAEPAAMCCGGECNCCEEFGVCPCAVEAPAQPAEPTPAPTPPNTSTPVRFFLPPATLLFTLPEADASPRMPVARVAHTFATDSHARALARLCVWRT